MSLWLEVVRGVSGVGLDTNLDLDDCLGLCSDDQFPMTLRVHVDGDGYVTYLPLLGREGLGDETGDALDCPEVYGSTSLGRLHRMCVASRADR